MLEYLICNDDVEASVVEWDHSAWHWMSGAEERPAVVPSTIDNIATDRRHPGTLKMSEKLAAAATEVEHPATRF